MKSETLTCMMNTGCMCTHVQVVCLGIGIAEVLIYLIGGKDSGGNVTSGSSPDHILNRHNN